VSFSQTIRYWPKESQSICSHFQLAILRIAWRECWQDQNMRLFKEQRWSEQTYASTLPACFVTSHWVSSTYPNTFMGLLPYLLLRNNHFQKPLRTKLWGLSWTVNLIGLRKMTNLGSWWRVWRSGKIRKLISMLVWIICIKW
jgi:hypothetical protein